MIRYGVNGKELKKSDDREIVLTGRGFVKRKKAEKRKSEAAIDSAKRLAEQRTAGVNREIIAHYAGRPAEELMVSEDERNWNRIKNVNGGKR